MLKRLYVRFLLWALAPALGRKELMRTGRSGQEFFATDEGNVLLSRSMIGDASIKSSILRSEGGELEVDFKNGTISLCPQDAEFSVMADRFSIAAR